MLLYKPLIDDCQGGVDKKPLIADICRMSAATLDRSTLAEVMRSLGRIGGRSRSPAKRAATQQNAAKARAARMSRRTVENALAGRTEPN